MRGEIGFSGDAKFTRYARSGEKKTHFCSGQISRAVTHPKINLEVIRKISNSPQKLAILPLQFEFFFPAREIFFETSKMPFFGTQEVFFLSHEGFLKLRKMGATVWGATVWGATVWGDLHSQGATVWGDRGAK